MPIGYCRDTTTCVEPEALTPKEFGARFKRSQSWAYRQIKEGRIRTLDLGRIMIPSTEVDRLFETAKAKATTQATQNSPFGKSLSASLHKLPVTNHGPKLMSDAFRRAGQG